MTVFYNYGPSKYQHHQL